MTKIASEGHVSMESTVTTEQQHTSLPAKAIKTPPRVKMAEMSGGPVTRGLNREKSFDEARTAVQSQIEKMFKRAAEEQQRVHQGGVLAARSRKGLLGGITTAGSDLVASSSPPPKTATPAAKTVGLLVEDLMEQRRQKQPASEASSTMNPVAKHGSVSGASSLASSGNTTRNRKPKPFRIHNHVVDNSSSVKDRDEDSHSVDSVDNLVNESNSVYAKRVQGQQNQRYTSLLSLNIKEVPSQSQDETRPVKTEVEEVVPPLLKQKTAKKKAPLAPPPKKLPAPPPLEKKPSITAKKPDGRPAKELKHLGSMTPEEQVDRFLQSVEEVNESTNSSRPRKVDNGNSKGLFSKNQSRVSSNGNARWRSMDNLNVATKKPINLNEKKKLPPFNKPNNVGKPTSVNQGKQQMPNKPLVSKASHRGPKSSVSMQNLDRLDEVAENRTPLNAKRKVEPRPAVGRERGSSTDEGKKRNRKLTNRSSEEEVNRSKRLSTSVSDLRQVSEESKSLSVRVNVVYLGRVSLGNAEDASSLSAIQLPLKDLYFNYMQLTMAGRRPHLSSLEITEQGLRVSYVREKQIGIQQVFNPFPTIAVWAAVRFLYRREQVPTPAGASANGSNNSRFFFAFLPLISDPGDAEKDQLFNPLARQDVKLAASYEHPAVFACIMRRGGDASSQKLDCHGFVCQSKDDAILVASNLYKSLMQTMQQQGEEGETKEEKSHQQSVKKQPPPQRPPRQRRKRTTPKRSSEDSSNNEDIVNEDDDQLGRVRRSHSEKFLDEIPSSSSRSRARRSISERRSLDDSDVATVSRSRDSAGDIYTKVAMPRSKSFMNVSGPYNLQELFRELREKEGIESVDDILRQVVSPEGMSYNRTSPMYRELLLKLAMSMSADEMFIRSKNIMMQEKLKRGVLGFNFGSRGVEAGGGGGKQSGFGKVLQIFGVAKKGRFGNAANNGKVSKADIGEPIPLSEDTKRELTKQWMKSSPHLHFDSLANPMSYHENSNNNNHSLTDLTSVANRKKGGSFGVAAAVQRKKNSSSNNNLANSVNDVTDSYVSCSECGYQSVCGTCCSCSMFATTTAAEEEEDDDEGTLRKKDKKSSSSSSYSAMSMSQSPSDTTVVHAPTAASSSANRKAGAVSPSRVKSNSSSAASSRRGGSNSDAKNSVGSGGKRSNRSNNSGGRQVKVSNAIQEEEPPSSSSSTSSGSSCSTCLNKDGVNKSKNVDKNSMACSCQYCGVDGGHARTDNDNDTTCYSCSAYSDSNASEATITNPSPEKSHQHNPRRPPANNSKSVDDSGANTSSIYTSADDSSSESGSASFDDEENSLAGAQSPLTAWKWNSRRNENAKLESSDEETASDATSIVSATHRPKQGGVARKQSSVNSARGSTTTNSGAEHVDGFFRNLSLVGDNSNNSNSGNSSKSVSFRRANDHVATRQQQQQKTPANQQHSKSSAKKQRPRSSADSLSPSNSSSQSSSSSIEEEGGKKPRQAYSEANMHNSLGYLP